MRSFLDGIGAGITFAKICQTSSDAILSPACCVTLSRESRTVEVADIWPTSGTKLGLSAMSEQLISQAHHQWNVVSRSATTRSVA